MAQGTARNVTLVQLMLNVYYFFSPAQSTYLPTELHIAVCEKPAQAESLVLSQNSHRSGRQAKWRENAAVVAASPGCESRTKSETIMAQQSTPRKCKQHGLLDNGAKACGAIPQNSEAINRGSYAGWGLRAGRGTAPLSSSRGEQ